MAWKPLLTSPNDRTVASNPSLPTFWNSSKPLSMGALILDITGFARLLRTRADIYALHKKRQQEFFALHNSLAGLYLTLWQETNFSLLSLFNYGRCGVNAAAWLWFECAAWGAAQGVARQ